MSVVLTALVSAALVRADAPVVRGLDHSVAFQAYVDQESNPNAEVTNIVIDGHDHSLAATSSYSGEVALWDLNGLTPYWRKAVGHWNTAMEFSHSGQLLAAGGNKQVVLLRLEDGATLRTMTPLNADGASALNYQSPVQMVFAGDDREVWVGYVDRIFRFDVATGRLIHRYGDDIFDGFWLLGDIQLSADERYLYTVDEKTFRAFSTTTHAKLRGFAFADVAGLDVTPISGIGPRLKVTADGDFTAYAFNHYINIIDNRAQRLVRRMFAAATPITGIGFTSDQCCVITAASDGTSRMFDIATGRELTRLDDSRPSPSRAWFTSVASPSNNDVILTGDARGEVRFWRP